MRLTESPLDRLREVTLGLASHRSLPNIFLGMHLGFWVTYVTGGAFPPVAVSGSAWLVSVILYAVADEVQAKIEAAKQRVLEDESDYYGIE